MDVSLSQNLQIEMNREDELEVDTVIGYDADYSARKRVSRRWECQCTPAEFPPSDVPPMLVRNPASDGKQGNVDNDEIWRNVNMRTGLREYFILRGLVITISMGGGTVVCRYMTIWL